jgi:threonine dehydrogenase-like Zn-dependent dehydrogenase
MTDGLIEYERAQRPIPAVQRLWPLYGAGLDNLGKEGRPIEGPVPEPAAHQLLARVDACSLCFSDLKVIKQGGDHPRLHHRDLQREPVILGHELSLTIVKVGENLRTRFQVGQRITVQPDVYYHGKAMAVGYTLAGGLQQYCLVGTEVLEGDDGTYLYSLGPELGFAEAALTEPWACVEAAYTPRRRLNVKAGGTLWVVGKPGDETAYHLGQVFAAGRPAKVVVTNGPASLRSQLAALKVPVVARDELTAAGYSHLREAESPAGFDDIIVLGITDGDAVEAIVRVAAPRATINFVGTQPLSRPASIDIGRIHYEYLAYLGTRGPDIGAAYGAAANRSEIRQEGIAWVVGAGGPMGRMHLQRLLEMRGGPRQIVATDIDTPRLQSLEAAFAATAGARGIRLVTLNSKTTEPAAFLEVLGQAHGGRGFDDIILLVPAPRMVEEVLPHLAEGGMLVIFAGIPQGNFAAVDLGALYLRRIQLTGTSGSNIQDQLRVLQKAVAGELSPGNVVAAIGGLAAAREGMRAMLESRYPGKVVIFPQAPDFPLTGLPELKAAAPTVHSRLGPGGIWSRAAESEFLRLYAR